LQAETSEIAENHPRSQSCESVSDRRWQDA